MRWKEENFCVVCYDLKPLGVVPCRLAHVHTCFCHANKGSALSIIDLAGE